MKTTSEFGKGFVYCLYLFAQHFQNDQMRKLGDCAFLATRTPEDLALILSSNPPSTHDYGKDLDYAKFWIKEIAPIYDNDPKKALSQHIELWANGASDHLYELTCPKIFKGTQIEKDAALLKEKGLRMGHGFLDKTYTMKDVDELRELTTKIICAVDKHLGTRVVQATWA